MIVSITDCASEAFNAADDFICRFTVAFNTPCDYAITTLV